MFTLPSRRSHHQHPIDRYANHHDDDSKTIQEELRSLRPNQTMIREGWKFQRRSTQTQIRRLKSNDGEKTNKWQSS